MRKAFVVSFCIPVLLTCCSTEEGQERKPIGSKRIDGPAPVASPETSDESEESQQEEESSSDETNENALCNKVQPPKVPVGENNKRPACLVMENWGNKRVIIDPDIQFEDDAKNSGYCFEFSPWVNSSIYKIATDQGKTLISGKAEACFLYEYTVQKASDSCSSGDYKLMIVCDSLTKEFCFSSVVSGVESLLEPLDGVSKISKDNLTCKQ